MCCVARTSKSPLCSPPSMTPPAGWPCVRSSLLERQADAIGLPVWQIPLPWPCTNDDYEARMAEACRRAVAEGFGTIAFGDLYLKDVRAYRERQLTGSGLTPVFPLWEIPTSILARDMIDGGL